MTEHADGPGLIGDIGGTHARFALTTRDGIVENIAVLMCDDFPDLFSAIEAYLDQTRPHTRPARGALAVACPVSGDSVTMTNRDWSFSTDALCRRLGFDTLTIVNDFVAAAAAVPELREGDRLQVGGGTAAVNAPIAVLGPGTGLGVAALVPGGRGWIPLATEGGHVTLAAANDYEADILAGLRRRFGHVSAERALSGPGLVNLYETVADIKGRKPARLSPEEVTEHGLAGVDSSCLEAVDLFCCFLGTVASDLALSLGARGGVYIAGGIVPALGDAFIHSGFRNRFEEKGRFSEYLAAVPTLVIVNRYPALLGLRALLDGQLEQQGEREPSGNSIFI
ncbi:MAG: glucokinase [Gammaproteobacteria bacterium]|nr:glucokinase [Gammaproteobacteria bacterium]